MNILVINLTRFGDLLQSAAAVRVLAHSDNGERNRIGVVCLENFIAGAELLPGVTDIYPLPAAKIMNLCNAGKLPPPAGAAAKGPAAWLGGLGCLHEWAAAIGDGFAPDAVCNISPSTPSSLLGRLLAGTSPFFGFTLDEFGFAHATSLWASFIQGASSARVTSPFNIVDLFRKVAGPESARTEASLLPVPESSVAAMRERLLSLAGGSPKGFVTLQLGASADIRRWPVASFAAVGAALWREHRLCPVLVGTKSELALGEEYAARATGPFVNLMGKTGLTELAAALAASSLCISNDTGTLHLASGLSVPVLGIYLATAQPWDTGPYAGDNCSLEPELACHPCDFGTSCPNGYACHRAVTPEVVFALADAKLRENVWDAANFAACPTPLGARVWKSTYDAFGFADLCSLSGHEKESRTQWMRLQRHLYRQFFDKKPGTPFTPAPFTAPLSLDPETGTTLARACDEILALFDALLQQAAMLAQTPLPPVRDRFFRTWHRLAAHLRSQPVFAAIAFSWQTEAMGQAEMDSAIALARQYHDFFSFLRSLLP
ncbi:Glycosyl transferase family 9 [uncultured delta proteobacterium]|uniref:Glycosyl transferase family 9 n=1 Tax=uncultured delta proteobacterium TaxID=34034 RepID=A0A212J5Q4_9DELT|nr:Glycosyl transferase family 9 [uncultured delta proteobacterium]